MTDIARLGMAVDTSGLRDGQRELRNLVSTGADAEKQIEGQTRRKSASWGRMAAKAGLALGAIGTGIGLAVRGQLNDIDRLAKESQKIGIPIEHLSQLRHVAELSGTSIEGMSAGLRRLSQNLVQDADKFEALGIAVRDANGEMRPTVEVMQELADVIAEMPDGADKTATAMNLMGRSGAEMIPLLNGGADALKEMMAEADRLGLTITDDVGKAAEAFNDNITRIQGAGRGFWQMIASELAPTLEKFSDILVDLVNRFGEMSPGMKSLLSNGALLMMVMAPLVAVVGALVGAVALIGAPLLIGAAAFAAIGAAVIAFWPDIKAAGEAIRDFADDIGLLDAIGIVFDGIKQQAQNFIDLFRAIFTGDLQGIMDSMVGIIATPLRTIGALWESEFADTIREAIAGVGDYIQEKFTELLEWFDEAILRIGETARVGFLEFYDAAVEHIGGAVEWIQTSFTELLEWFGELPGKFLEFGRNMVQGLINGFNEMWEAFKENIREKVDWIPDWIKRRLGIASPSQVFHEIGMNIGRGLSGGIDDSFGMVRSAVQGLGDEVANGAWDMASSVVDAMGSMFQGSKPIAMAQALINTWQGVTAALAEGPTGIPKAVAIAAQGLAAVAKISSARPGSAGGGSRASSSGGSSSGASQAPAPPTQTVIIDAPGMDLSEFVRMGNEAAKRGHLMRFQQA